MHFAERSSGKELLRPSFRGWVPDAGGLLWLILCVLPCSFPSPALAQSQQPSAVQGTGSAPDARGKGASGGAPGDQQLPASISGTIIDQTGAVSRGAQVRLTREDQFPKQEAVSGDNGQFSFANLPPGPFQLTISSAGFATHSVSGILRPGEAYIVPPIRLTVAPAVADVQVALPQAEVAEMQIKEQEKQRVLGFIPNFYVSYVPDAAPLAPKQKFELAWRSMIDPITFVGVGALAGFEQASDDFQGYGQGAQGYAKRYGAGYADAFVGTFIGSAILPSLLKQDPRYFYKGTGSIRSRTLYALATAVICKGDNKRWQPNYSAILGGFASGGISYLYYPAGDRGAGLLVQNSLLSIAESGIAGVFQEFVVRKLTPHLPSRPTNPGLKHNERGTGKSRQQVKHAGSENSE
jgi:hypothetical protein